MTARNLKVLLVDDEPDIRAILRYSLLDVNPDLVIEEAADGNAAIEAHLSGEFDLILLDVDMPEMNGWQAIKTIRNARKNAWVVMVTARKTPEDIQRAQTLGADGFMGKPFELEQVERLFNAIVENADKESRFCIY